MKKIILSILLIIFITGCSNVQDESKDDELSLKIKKLEDQIKILEEIKGNNLVEENSECLNKQINIGKPTENKITKQGIYSLDCKTHYYNSAIIGGNIIEETYIKFSEGHERDTLYINNDSAKYFGADYEVIQDDDSYLIMIRHYSVSGLTEIVSINKELGIGFDTKTLSFGLSGAPNSDTYLLSCKEV